MKHSLLLILFILVGLNSSAQSTRDFQAWTGADVSFKLNKNWKLELREQLRFNENISSFGSLVSQVSFENKLNKHFSWAPALRYTYKSTADNIRVSADFNFKTKANKLRFKNRLRVQHAAPLGELGNKTWIREKIGFSYNLSKLVDPYLSGEIFFRLNGRNEFRIWRATVGLDWNLPKRFSVKTFYRIEQEFNKSNTEQNHIVGLLIGYDFKRKKRTASN